MHPHPQQSFSADGLGWRSIPALVERLNAGAKKPTFTENAIRYYVRHRQTNGLAPHVRYIGRKIVIHEPGFLAWLAGETDQGAAA